MFSFALFWHFVCRKFPLSKLDMDGNEIGVVFPHNLDIYLRLVAKLDWLEKKKFQDLFRNLMDRTHINGGIINYATQ